MTRKYKYPELERFLVDLEKLITIPHPVVAWSDAAHKEAAKLGRSDLVKSFLRGAIPEFYGPPPVGKRATKLGEAAKELGIEWRSKNPGMLNVSFWNDVFFKKQDGTFVSFRVPLDRQLICSFAQRVIAARKSFS